jgi:hypothetical protein
MAGCLSDSAAAVLATIPSWLDDTDAIFVWVCVTTFPVFVTIDPVTVFVEVKVRTMGGVLVEIVTAGIWRIEEQ